MKRGGERRKGGGREEEERNKQGVSQSRVKWEDLKRHNYWSIADLYQPAPLVSVPLSPLQECSCIAAPVTTVSLLSLCSHSGRLPSSETQSTREACTWTFK